MNCIIPGGNLKIVSKALYTLAKIGDELYIEAKPNCLQFITINQSKTCYITYNFDNVFFSTYEVNTTESVTCKVYMKAVLNVFKAKGSKEKKVDFCKIELENDAERIVFKLKYKQDFIVTHNLKLIDMEFIAVSYDRSKMANELSSSSHFFSQILNNFQTTDSDMNVDVKRAKVIVRNYDIAATNVGRSIRSQVVLNANEFISYKIAEETNITMCFKPFRAAIAFAEVFNLQVILNFDTGGKPVNLLIKSTTFEVNFILSTISSDGSTQSCTNSQPSVASNARSKTKNLELSKEDQTMLETLNWDSDFEVDENDILLNGNGNKNDAMETADIPEPETELIVDDIIPESPESPRTKRLKHIFGRCFEATCNESKFDFGEELAPNSDSE